MIYHVDYIPESCIGYPQEDDMVKTHSYTLPQDLIDWLAKTAKERDLSASKLLVQIIRGSKDAKSNRAARK
jgi:hypothetical protein